MLERLRAVGVDAIEIIRVSTDAVLYLHGESRVPMTAWRWWADGGERFTFDQGFLAVPSARAVNDATTTKG